MQYPGILGSDQSEISPLLCTLPNRMSRTLWIQYTTVTVYVNIQTIQAICTA